MKYVDEFRDPEQARAWLERIAEQARQIAEPVALMEVCGGHTHAIFRHGIEQLLPPNIELLHGPGCPVCVLPIGRVDECVAIAETPGVLFTSFGDALRVPGSRKSLLDARADGADVRTVYSPLDALALAKQHPEREVVFFALGFETTMPSTALTLLQAAREGVRNFSILCHHIVIIPALVALLEAPGVRIDGLLAPGHVSVVIGTAPYEVITTQHARPLVVTGFEPLDILQGIFMLLRQLAAGEARVENQYGRAVTQHGNPQALAAITEVFEPRASFEWRGLGSLPHSGVSIRERFATFDAERRFALVQREIADPPACQCGEVLRGEIKPWDCRLFGTTCTPTRPMGALMVSSEGACAAYHRFARVPSVPGLVALARGGAR
jgi:hydrogenase expression/formation protein HypD